MLVIYFRLLGCIYGITNLNLATSTPQFFAERIIKPWNSLPANNETF